MKKTSLYRYTSNNEGVWSAGRRLLPENLIKEANEERKWLKKPALLKGDYLFYMTEKGKDMYEKTLLKVHQKYLSNIKCEKLSFDEVIKNGEVAYEDKYQLVIKIHG